MAAAADTRGAGEEAMSVDQKQPKGYRKAWNGELGKPATRTAFDQWFQQRPDDYARALQHEPILREAFEAGRNSADAALEGQRDVLLAACKALVKALNEQYVKLGPLTWDAEEAIRKTDEWKPKNPGMEPR
jgi:hypothetical protein